MRIMRIRGTIEHTRPKRKWSEKGREEQVGIGRREIVIDGNTVNLNLGTVYRGLGVVTGNNSSRLLLDYKELHPESYWQIMRLLFQPDYGLGLSLVKLEFGADVNSSSGTEPCIMRSAEEVADVTRGAGFIFAADAKKVNPDVKVDLLRWGEPRWVRDAFDRSKEDGLEARYRWYLSAIEGAYDTFGLCFDNISADGNEPAGVDQEWIVYFSKRLKAEKNPRYDYSAIRIVASDEVGTWHIAQAMMANEELRGAVDILGEHYNTWGNENTRILNEVCGKEIWYTEGIASMNQAHLAVNADGVGITGTNGALDVCNRIINGYYNGRMTMYEYQPAVAAYYSGVRYFPKSVIIANTPWNGCFEVDAGIWTGAHFTHFMKNGWRYVDSACYGDGEENHFIKNTTHNYMTVMNPETGDYSMVICNDSAKERRYEVKLVNMDKAMAPYTVWETRGPEKGQAYDANYMRRLGTYYPTKSGEEVRYFVDLRPYSVVTVTTLDKKNIDISVTACCKEPCPLAIGYEDDFSYPRDFLKRRGSAPLYTTDYGGAFEVGLYNDRQVLEQKITGDIKPTEWHYGYTPDPITFLGDDTWSNYSASAEFFLVDAENNYVDFGIRHLCADLHNPTATNGLHVVLWADGRGEVYNNTAQVQSFHVGYLMANDWHEISLTAVENVLSVRVDSKNVAEVVLSGAYNHSGRVCLRCGLYNNYFRRIGTSAVEGHSPYVKRVDDLDSAMTYDGAWDHRIPDSFQHFNRTRSVAQSGDGENRVTFHAEGGAFALIGQTEACGFRVYIDGVFYREGRTDASEARQCFYRTPIPGGRHEVSIVVTEGEFALDAVEHPVDK